MLAPVLLLAVVSSRSFYVQLASTYVCANSSMLELAGICAHVLLATCQPPCVADHLPARLGCHLPALLG